MNVPIKREDIKAGDRLRVTGEFTASKNWCWMAGDTSTYELIERPVALPDVPGWYQGSNFPLSKGCSPYCLNTSGAWVIDGSTMPTEYMWRHAGELALLRPVAEVAAEVLAALLLNDLSGDGLYTRKYCGRELRAVAAKFGVTK